MSSHATVLNDGRIGENVFLLEDNTIQPFVSIGNNVTLWSGNHIGHHSTIHDHCFLASHIVVSGGVVIEEQSSLASMQRYATISPSVHGVWSERAPYSLATLTRMVSI